MPTTPNMNLLLPTPGVTSGPQYGVDQNNAFTIVDGHNHTSGYGVQVPSAGLNIDSDLSFNTTNILSPRTVRFSVLSAAPAGAQDLDCLYVQGVDLYYIDGAGNNVRMTQSGSVSGSAGTITGLPSGTASAAFAAGTFVFQSATSTSAVLDAGSLILRNNTANSKGLTLSPPNAMSVDYTVTLPGLPSVTSVVNCDSSGNLGTRTYDQVGLAMTSTGANAIGQAMTSTGANAVVNSISISGVNPTPANVIVSAATVIGANALASVMNATGANSIGAAMNPAGANAVAASRTRSTSASTVGVGGVLITASSGNFFTSAGPTDVTNLSGSITTSGRPIQLIIAPDTNGLSYIGAGGGLRDVGVIAIYRGSTLVGSVSTDTAGAAVVLSGLCLIDPVGAGTYSYFAKATFTSSGGFFYVKNMILIAYEL